MKNAKITGSSAVKLVTPTLVHNNFITSNVYL